MADLGKLKLPDGTDFMPYTQEELVMMADGTTLSAKLDDLDDEIAQLNNNIMIHKGDTFELGSADGAYVCMGRSLYNNFAFSVTLPKTIGSDVTSVSGAIFGASNYAKYDSSTLSNFNTSDTVSVYVRGDTLSCTIANSSITSTNNVLYHASVRVRFTFN